MADDLYVALHGGGSLKLFEQTARTARFGFAIAQFSAFVWRF